MPPARKIAFARPWMRDGLPSHHTLLGRPLALGHGGDFEYDRRRIRGKPALLRRLAGSVIQDSQVENMTLLRAPL